MKRLIIAAVILVCVASASIVTLHFQLKTRSICWTSWRKSSRPTIRTIGSCVLPWPRNTWRPFRTVSGIFPSLCAMPISPTSGSQWPRFRLCPGRDDGHFAAQLRSAVSSWKRYMNPRYPPFEKHFIRRRRRNVRLPLRLFSLPSSAVVESFRIIKGESVKRAFIGRPGLFILSQQAVVFPPGDVVIPLKASGHNQKHQEENPDKDQPAGGILHGNQWKAQAQNERRGRKSATNSSSRREYRHLHNRREIKHRY